MTKTVSQLDADGYFVGPVVADESPLELGVFLLPALAVDAPPPVMTPGTRARWNGEGFEVTDIQYPNPEPPETIAEAKNRVWREIMAERDLRKSGGVKIEEKWFHSDDSSRIQHLGLKDQARDMITAGLPDTTRLQKLGADVRWKTMDGSFIYLTVRHAFDIVAAVGDLDALAFTAAEVHRMAMESCADPSAYDFSAGWPDIYEEA